ncbi:sulfurtransferase TusA family protein [Corallincola platygyrae]|uniref:Sulfurtransferase TusA family protein n=1 Tax=Corallincola platygyrae TaxID=1193278 RepID=A0ABW4XR56_9GAMM
MPDCHDFKKYVSENQFVLNLGGVRCPAALIEAKLALREMVPGQQLVILDADMTSISDISSFAEAKGYVVSPQQCDTDSPTITITKM